MKIVASNNIDVGDMTGKFEFFNKSFYKKLSRAGGGQQDVSGHHLILFDGKKQQIIKLDADIDLKPKKQPPKTAPAAERPAAPHGKTYDQYGLARNGPGDLADPTSIIAQNK